MLARLSRQGNQWLSVQVERSLSSRGDGESFSVDLNLASLVCPPDLSWSVVAGLCERSILPVYRGLRNIVEEDIEHVSRLLSELEPLGEHTQNEGTERPSPVAPLVIPTRDVAAAEALLPCPQFPPLERPRRKRRRSPHASEPLVIHPSDPSAPIVVVTPCPDEPRETSCWAPCQDASFGQRLTIPTHVPLNKVHPPLVTNHMHTAARIERWEYMGGHWCAVVPMLEEQCRRGMYSRPTNARTRPRSRCLPSQVEHPIGGL